MIIDLFFKKAAAVVLLFFVLLSGVPWALWSALPLPQGRIVDESYFTHSPFALSEARAAAKTKTVVFLVGSVISTASTTSGTTSTFTFTIALPDIVPSAQPIRSAYIQYNTWENALSGITASVFTLNKQGGSAQSLTGPKLTGGTTEQQLSIRLDATAAMRTLVGSASTSIAMMFTAKITGSSRIGENAELYITYDYDPLAATQVNTAYQYVYAATSQLSTTNVTSTPFNFNLPEASVTSTFAVGASSTNHFWIEYRGFITSSTNVTATVGWNAESTSSATFAQTTQQFSFLLLSAPKTANVSPTGGTNTFRMISSVANGISAPTAIAVTTYTFNFSASAKLRKTVQALLFQSTSTASATAVNGTTTINIPETSPSSTNIFLLGRFSHGTSTNPGINAFMTTSTCTAPTSTGIAVTIGTQAAKNTGYATVVKDITPSSTMNASGNWNICSIFTKSAIANIPGLMVYIGYDYANNFAAGSRFNTNVSFLGASHLSATGTTGGIFAASGINTSIADASATATYSWLDAEFDNNAAGTAAQALTLGIGTVTSAYTFVARGTTARREGATFSATSSGGFTAGVTTTVQCSVACINDAAYNVLGQTNMVAANLTQAHFHWRNDDNSESSATPQAAEDVATSTIQGTVDRLRIEINNAGDASSSANFRLEFATATSGPWTQLATSTVGTSAWQMATSTQGAAFDGTPTTNIATSSGGTTDANLIFFPGEVVASTSRNQTATDTLTGVQFSEYEFTIQSNANAAGGTTYYFRLSNAGTSTGMTYSVYPSIAVVAAASPVTVSAVGIASSTITLTPATTTPMNVFATVTDTSGCAAITGGTTTVALYRYGVGSSTCMSSAGDPLNCYLATAFTASSTCAGNSINTTTTFNLYYFTQPTDGSSTFSGQGWQAAVVFKDGNNATGSASSATSTMSTLAAINVTTSSINYGNLAPGVTSATSTTTIMNAGNSSTTLKLSASAILTSSSGTIGADYQHYATSSFVWSSGGGDVHLSTTSAAVAGFVLVAPTTTANVQSSIYWALQPPLGTASGTYAGVNQFTAVYTP